MQSPWIKRRRRSHSKPWFATLSQSEKEVVIHEMASRMKDVVYMNAERKMLEATNNLEKRNMSPDDSITITYNFGFIMNDIIQIVGHYRRRT